MQIKSIFLILAFMVLQLGASTYKYRVVSPLFGTLGVITINSNISSSRYSVKAQAITKGIASTLTKSRREFYISKGHKRNLQYVTDIFKITRIMKSKKEIDEYIFSHKSSTVIKRRLRWKHNHLKKDDKKSLKYHTNIDLVALYINVVPKLIGTFGVKKSFMVAGADKIGGNVIVYTPSKTRAKKELKRLGIKRANIIIVTTNGKIFDKRGREIVMAIDNKGVLKKAWLKTIPVVGTLYIKLIK